jgi:membrane associated rhomboid family serine protease
LRAARAELGIIRAAICWIAPTVVRALDLSPPERVAIGIALALIVLHAVGAGDALEYRRASLAAAPWRALTGHLVHLNWPHALVNAAALWVVARLYAADLDAVRQRLWIPAALAAGGWIKVILEQPGDASTAHADWLGAAVVPQAHLAGALCGTVLGALFALAQPRAEQQRAEQ